MSGKDPSPGQGGICCYNSNCFYHTWTQCAVLLFIPHGLSRPPPTPTDSFCIPYWPPSTLMPPFLFISRPHLGIRSCWACVCTRHVINKGQRTFPSINSFSALVSPSSVMLAGHRSRATQMSRLELNTQQSSRHITLVSAALIITHCQIKAESCSSSMCIKINGYKAV